MWTEAVTESFFTSLLEQFKAVFSAGFYALSEVSISYRKVIYLLGILFCEKNTIIFLLTFLVFNILCWSDYNRRDSWCRKAWASLEGGRV